MKTTSQAIRTIFTIICTVCAMQVFAQTAPVVNVPAENRLTASTDKDYSFSAVGKKAGIINNGGGTVVFSGTVNFRNDDTLYIGQGVIFNPEYINGFSSGCMIINAGTANLDDCLFTGGQVDNYGVMTASYLGVTNFTFNNYAAFNMVNGCSLNASQIVNQGTLATGYLGMTGDPSTIRNEAGGNMTITSSGRVAVNGSMLRNEGNLKVVGFLTTDAGTTVINKGRLNTVYDLNIAGTVTNKGIMVTGGKMNVAATATLFNSCRMVTGQLYNAAAKTGNYGILWVLENTYGAFTNNGTVKNAGYIRTTQFINAAGGTIINTLTNAFTNGNSYDGAIRIEGGAGTLESLNYGIITGGKICDASNQSYVLDTFGTGMNAVMIFINAYDTTTYQAAPQTLPCNCTIGGQANEVSADVQLTGEKLAGYNQLNWQITNAAGLVATELQMATNEQDYIAMQSGNSAAAQQISGSFQDVQPGVVNYYRLKMTDTSGNITFSNVVRLGVQWAAGIEQTAAAVTTAEIAYFPNPFTDNINITMKAAQYEAVQVQLSDLAGRNVTTVDYNAQKGDNNFNVPGLQNLIPGIYVLTLRTAVTSQVFQYKIVKQ